MSEISRNTKQSCARRYVDDAGSKTVNLPSDITVEDTRRICWLAYKLKCKGITVYRYGSKKEQALYIGPLLTKEMATEKHVSADSEYSGGCPSGECPF